MACESSKKIVHLDVQHCFSPLPPILGLSKQFHNPLKHSYYDLCDNINPRVLLLVIFVLHYNARWSCIFTDFIFDVYHSRKGGQIYKRNTDL